MRCPSYRQAFTLIELLVVIAIIALLGAILFPVFARAKESARRTGCLSNCKQLGLGTMLYADDYDEMLPPPYQFNVGRLSDWKTASFYGQPFLWMDCVLPYVKNYQIFACPSRPNDGVGFDEGWMGVGTRAIGYAINKLIEPHWTGRDAKNLSGIVNPSGKLLFLECYRGDWQVMPNMVLHVAIVGSQVHNEMENFVYFDGHAKSLRARQTVNPHSLWNPTDVYPCVAAWDGSLVNSEQELRDYQNYCLDFGLNEWGLESCR